MFWPPSNISWGYPQKIFLGFFKKMHFENGLNMVGREAFCAL